MVGGIEDRHDCEAELRLTEMALHELLDTKQLIREGEGVRLYMI
jgi:hypothetical protein